jgi:spore coat protein U-like protein
MTAKLGLATALILVAGQAYASTTITNTFGVQLAIQAQCTIVSTQTLDFGSNGVINANIDNQADLHVQCTNTTPFNIGLDAGANGGTTTTRLMKGGPTNETIQYQLFSDTNHGVNWGNTIGSDTVASAGNGSSQTFTVYGRVPPQTTPTPGSYSDTVTVSVTY